MEIYSSLTRTSIRKFGLRSAIPFLGIHKSKFICIVAQTRHDVLSLLCVRTWHTVCYMDTVLVHSLHKRATTQIPWLSLVKRRLRTEIDLIIFFISPEADYTDSIACICPCRPYTDEKENKIFLIYKEIQTGSGAK